MLYVVFLAFASKNTVDRTNHVRILNLKYFLNNCEGTRTYVLYVTYADICTVCDIRGHTEFQSENMKSHVQGQTSKLRLYSQRLFATPFLRTSQSGNI